MGTVTRPALLILPKFWTAGNTRGVWYASLWLEHWQPWQYAGTLLPAANHRTAVHRGDTFAADFGELSVYFAHLTPLQDDILAAGGPPFPLGPFGQPIPVEPVYAERGPLDAADVLSVVLTGFAMRAGNADPKTETAAGVGACFAGVCSGTTQADTMTEGASPFVRTWKGVIALAESNLIGPADFPDTLGKVPVFIDHCRAMKPELFK